MKPKLFVGPVLHLQGTTFELATPPARRWLKYGEPKYHSPTTTTQVICRVLKHCLHLG